MNLLADDGVSQLKQDRSLLTYAFLAQTSYHGNDLVSGLIPIFRPIVKMREGQQFDPVEFSDAIRKTYGLDIHPWASEDFAIRLVEAGLLFKRVLGPKHHSFIYASVQDELTDVDHNDVRLLVDKFIAYARTRLQSYTDQVEDKQLESALLDHLVTTDFFAIVVKPDQSKINNRGPKTLSVRKSEDQNKKDEQLTIQAAIDVLVAGFIYDLYANDQPLYELLIKISNGALLAEVVLNFQSPDTNVSLENLTIILDAPFIMAALDLCEREQHEYAKRLLSRLFEKNATIATFQHYCEEISDNLETSLKRFESGNSDRATDRRMADPAFRAYAANVRQNSRAAAEDLGLKIISSPSVTALYSFFSKEDEEDYFKTLGHYHNVTAQQRDVDSVAATMRLRRGKRAAMSKFHTCDYVFVTNNPWMPSRTSGFLARRNKYEDGEAPPVISDKYLAGLLWVLFGGQAEDLSRIRLLANCAQALEARGDVIGKVYKFLQGTDETKARRFKAIMTSERAGHHLMELSLGDSRLVTENNFLTIYQEIENGLEEKYKSLLTEELGKALALKEEELNNKYVQHLASASAEKDDLQTQLNHTHQSIGDLQQKYLDAQAVALEEKERQRDLSGKVDALTKALDEIKESERLTIQKHLKVVSREINRLESRISLAVILNTAMITLVAANLLEAGALSQIFSTLTLSALAWLTCWKIPDRVFGRYLEKRRENEFASRLSLAGLETKLPLYDIDWVSEEVTTRPINFQP